MAEMDGPVDRAYIMSVEDLEKICKAISPGNDCIQHH